jgi:hypothetical protein
MLTQEQANGLLLLALRHIEASHPSLTEEVTGEGQSQFRFTNASGTEEKKRSFWPARMSQAQFSTPQNSFHPTKDVILPDDVPP